MYVPAFALSKAYHASPSLSRHFLPSQIHGTWMEWNIQIYRFMKKIYQELLATWPSLSSEARERSSLTYNRSEDRFLLGVNIRRHFTRFLLP